MTKTQQPVLSSQ